MKEFAFYLLLILMGVAWAQTEEEVPEDGNTETQTEEISKDEEAKCICPEEEVQQESYQLFPPNSVFIISPLPEAPVSVAPERKIIPGYIEHLESGYSDSSYKQIPPND